MADDLRCFFEDRPIRARRTSEFERLWRWSRRNPLIAGLSGLALVLLVTVAAVFAVGNHRTNLALKSAVDAAQTAHDERLRAEGNLRLAVKALDEITQNVSERGIPQTLQIGVSGAEAPLQNVMVTEADAALLTSLLHFFDEFASENRADLNAQTATALQRIGAIQQRLGKLAEAESAFERSADIYRKLIAADPRDSRLRFDLAATWNQIGTVRSQKGSLPDAIEAHVAALDALRSSDAVAASDAGKFRLAETYTLIGTAGSRVGGGEVAARLRGPPERDPPPGSRRSRSRFGGPERRGDRPELDESPSPQPSDVPPTVRPEFWLEEEGPPPARLFDRDEATGRAVKLLQELLDHEPQNPDYQFALAKAFRAKIHGGPRGRRQGNEAIDVRRAADDAIQILRGLVSRFPNSSIYTYELAGTLIRVVQRIHDLEPHDRATHVHEAQQLATQLVSAHPQAPEYQALLAGAERRLGEFAHRGQQTGEAAERYRRALDLYSQLYERFPSVSLYQVGYAQTLSEWAEVQRASGQRDAAEETLARALSIAEHCAASWPRDPMFRDFLADLRRQSEILTRGEASSHSPP